MTARRNGFGGTWRWLAIAAALGLMLAALLALRGEVDSAGAALRKREKEVEIDHFAYRPPTLTVAAGAKVVFHNSSGTAHTATRRGSFDTGTIRPGRSVSIRFNSPGTFAYHCSIHPFMHGKIVVK